MSIKITFFYDNGIRCQISALHHRGDKKWAKVALEFQMMQIY